MVVKIILLSIEWIAVATALCSCQQTPSYKDHVIKGVRYRGIIDVEENALRRCRRRTTTATTNTVFDEAGDRVNGSNRSPGAAQWRR